jgi:hypothetical protein
MGDEGPCRVLVSNVPRAKHNQLHAVGHFGGRIIDGGRFSTYESIEAWALVHYREVLSSRESQ